VKPVKLKAKWRRVDLRKSIKDQLKAMGKTAYWLAKTQTTRHSETVQLYLRGKQDTTGESIQELLELVGLDVGEKKT